MKIGLLVPSRERLNLKLTLIRSIITSVNNINNVNLYFGIDADDETLSIVQKISDAIPFVNVQIIQNNNQFIGINRIWNMLADKCTDEIFGYIGDDMIFRTPNWDEIILNEFTGDKLPKDCIKMVHAWDGYHGEKLSVNAFVHRKYYEVMGYFCRPEFLINYSDNWMYQTFSAFNRATYLSNIFIEHNHWIFGNRPKDNVANRMLSNNNDKISDALWQKLEPERRLDITKLGKYLNIEPNWTKVN